MARNALGRMKAERMRGWEDGIAAYRYPSLRLFGGTLSQEKERLKKRGPRVRKGCRSGLPRGMRRAEDEEGRRCRTATESDARPANEGNFLAGWSSEVFSPMKILAVSCGTIARANRAIPE